MMGCDGVMTKLLAALICAAALSACAAPGVETAAAPQAGRACFDPDGVRTFDLESGNILRIETFREGVFAAKILSICPDLSSAQALGFAGAKGLKICGGSGAAVVINDRARGRQTCRIGAVDPRPAAAEKTVTSPASAPP